MRTIFFIEYLFISGKSSTFALAFINSTNETNLLGNITKRFCVEPSCGKDKSYS